MQHENIPVNTTDVRKDRPIIGKTMSFRVGSPNRAIMWGFNGSKAVVKLRNIPEIQQKISCQTLSYDGRDFSNLLIQII